MFNDKNKIKSDRDYYGHGHGTQSLKPVAFILGALATVSIVLDNDFVYDVKNTLSDMLAGREDNKDIPVFNISDNKDAMFCPAPGGEALDIGNMFEDPFKKFTFGNAEYLYFWLPADKPKTLSFDFAMNATKTSDHEDFFDSIPQHVIDDPGAQFILSGHASYDLDQKYGVGLGTTRLPSNFEAIEKRYAEINKRTVDSRLEYIKQRLIEKGISEDRIHLHNFVARFNRRAVDVEVCFEGADPTPDAE